MNVQTRNDVAIYCLSSGPTLPEWISERARRNLAKKDESIRRRIELLQDFQMPASSSKIAQSADGKYILAAGTYPPRIRCYDVHELSMKFERYVDAGIIDIVMLGEDYGKFALLREDRTISFHAPYGHHESIRIPTFGRAMAYEPTTCELLVAGQGSNVYRVNLDEGRFCAPWIVDPPNTSPTCITVCPSHPLASVGCDDGHVRFWDSRSPDIVKPFRKLDVFSATEGYGYVDERAEVVNSGEITSIAHDPTGLYMAVGTAGGLVALYDVRSSRPLHIQEHKHGLPINTVRFHPTSGLCLSSDEKLIKAWHYKAADDMKRHARFSIGGDGSGDLGSVKVNIECSAKINHFIVAGDEKDPYGDSSGVILCATDQPKMESYYVPAIGTAPKWCSFLEGITEELEERDLNRDGSGTTLVQAGQETIYENYKFVSRDDIDKLGVSNLVGTPLLRGYMHGFFMDINLYNRLKAVANPFEYEEYQKKKLKERLQAKQASRIAPRASDRKKKVPVNAELAERLEAKAVDSSKAGKVASQLLSDDRFGRLFTNPDFFVDEDDENFKLRNPSGIAAAKRKAENLDSDDEGDDAVDPEDSNARDIEDEATSVTNDSGVAASDEAEWSDSDDDGFAGGRVRGEAYEDLKAINRQTTGSLRQRKSKKIIMRATEELDANNALEIGLGAHDATRRVEKRLEEINLPLGKRVAKLADADRVVHSRGPSGSKQASFIPKAARKRMEEASGRRGQDSRKRNRRGVKELGFKTPFRNKK